MPNDLYITWNYNRSEGLISDLNTKNGPTHPKIFSIFGKSWNIPTLHFDDFHKQIWTEHTYVVWNQNKTEGFVTTSTCLAYEVRKSASSNCYTEEGEHSPTAEEFCHKWYNDNCTTEIFLPTSKSKSELAIEKDPDLGWDLRKNLLWLSEQSDRPDFVPCGMPTGAFLLRIAEFLPDMSQDTFNIKLPQGDGTAFVETTPEGKLFIKVVDPNHPNGSYISKYAPKSFDDAVRHILGPIWDLSVPRKSKFI